LLSKLAIEGKQNGRLGSRFLRRYNVIFDFSRERLILEPRAAGLRGGNAAR